MPAISCPRCGGRLELDPGHVGWQVRCPHCAGEFLAGSTPAAAPPPVAPPQPGAAPYPAPYPPPYPGPWGYADSPEVAMEAGARAVYGAALALQIVAFAHLALILAVVALFGVLAAAGGQNKPGDMIAFAVIGALYGVFGVPYFAAIAYGAVQMKRLRSRGWAMTAVIMAMASIGVFGACGVIPLGIGIWGLIAVLSPEATAGFRAREARQDESDRGGGY